MLRRAPPPSHPRLDRVDRHPGARHRRALRRPRARRPQRRALLGAARRAGPRATACARIALADADAGARAAEAWTDGEVLAGAEGLVRLVARVRRRPRAQRARRLRRPRADGRGARRGHRPRAGQQGVARRRRRARHAARRGHRRADLPVDSEHSALHQLLAGERPGRVERSSLTASRRPVPRPQRATSSRDVTVEEALEHPTWAMGGKITIDSATLMNKGLEVIEAHHLFGTPYERIDVVVHPQSIVHALRRALRRRRARAPRLSRHARPDRLRAAPPRARRRAGARARPGRGRRADFEPVDPDAFPCLRLAREAAVAGGTAPCVLNAANEIAVHAFLERAPGLPRHPGGDRGDARAAAGRAGPRVRVALRGRPRGARGWPPSWSARAGRRPAHELVPRLRRLRGADHPPRARATSPRRRRSACASSASSLFFPPLSRGQARRDRVRDRGRSRSGGYVKITGMSPHEELPPEVADRAYYRQPVWKRDRRHRRRAGGEPRCIAFLIMLGLFLVNGQARTRRVGRQRRSRPAAARPAGRATRSSRSTASGYAPASTAQISAASTRCARRRARTAAPAPPVDGCRATTPAHGRRRRAAASTVTLDIAPRYDADAERDAPRVRLRPHSATSGRSRPRRLSVIADVDVTDGDGRGDRQVFYDTEARKQVSGVVGSYEATRQSIEFDTAQALWILALISLSLAIINLFPFLPLDGGHIFWALAEKVRGRPIPFAIIERASVVGFLLVAFLFVVGCRTTSADSGEGFDVR